MAKTLKMMKGDTYLVPPVFGDREIRRGDEVTVESDKVADCMLADFYVDKAGNQHFYFAEVGAAAVETADDAGEVGEVADKPRRARSK